MIGRGIGIPFRRGTGGGGTTDIPPAIKKSIIAWYSPKKQKLTNYDVIESYVTDFTKWRTADKNYVGLTIRSSSFSISFNKVSDHVIMWKPNYLFNEEGQVKLQVSGITNNVSIIIKHGTQEFPIVNGVNTFSFTQEENKSLSFVCKNVFQDTNITITQLPTSILKDFSGNGNHAYLYGGKGKLNSGMGVYQTDFSSWQFYPQLSTVEYSPEQLIIEKVNGPAQFCASSFVGKFIAEVSGIPDGVLLYYQYIDKITGNTVSTTLSNGINEIDCSNANGDANMTNMFLIGANNKDINITITQIPDYPDQLCYDGKMYAVCYGFPILEDYTVMADRTWFDKEEYSAFVSNSLGDMEDPSNGAFSVEVKSLDSFTVMSFGSLTNISTPEKGITYQTKQSYNGNSINVGTKESNDVLTLGGRYYYKNNNSAGNLWNGCHGKIIIADRSFTEEEINWLKQNWDKI